MSVPPLSLPLLSGELVCLREWRETDIAVVQEASRDPLIPLVTTVPPTADEPEALAFIRRQHDRLLTRSGYAFAITDREDRAVGHIGLFFADGARASAGYWVARSQRGRGYATDALRALTDWAIGLEGLDRVELSVEPWNEASWRVAERAGYEREGLLRAWKRLDGRPSDMYMYAQLTENAKALTRREESGS